MGLVLFACSPYFNIASINLEGNDKITRVSLISVAGISEGMNIFALNIDEIEEKIKTLHYVDTVEVARRLPDVVDIKITESKIAAYVPFMGNFIGIDHKGKILETIGSGEERKFPTFVGVNAKEFLIGQTVSLDQSGKFNVMLKYIEGIAQNEYNGLIDTVDISVIDDVNFTLWEKMVVYIGNEDKLDYKLKFLHQMLAEIGDATGGTINFQSPQRATYSTHVRRNESSTTIYNEG